MKPRILNSARLSFPLASAIAALLAVPSANAATLYWDGATTTANADGGAGTWNATNTNWDTRPLGGTDATWNSTDTAFFGGVAGTVSLGGPITVGGLIFNTTAYTIQTNALTFGGTDNLVRLNVGVTAATISSAIGTSTANMTFTAQNPFTTHTLTFGGAGGWTGSTTINAGTTLQLNSASTALLTTSGITLNGGSIIQNATSDANRISNTAGITSFGGTLATNNSSGSNVYAETIGTVTLERGLTTFVHNTNSAGAGSQTLTLSGLTRTGTGNTSSINFASASGLNLTKNIIIVTGATTTPAGQIIGAWATAGNSGGAFDYAVYGASGQVLAAGATLAAGGEATWTVAGNAYNNDVVTQTLTASRTFAALRNTAATATLTLASGFNLATTGVLNGAGTTFTIAPGTGGVLTTPAGSQQLYLSAGVNGTTGGTLTVSAPIANNASPVTVVKTGVGPLNLTGANTFTGGITVNSGTVAVNGTNTFATGAAGADVINGGSLTYSTLASWGGTGRNVTFNGTGTLASTVTGYSGGTLTLNAGANGAISLGTTSITFATTTGAGNLTVTNAGGGSVNLATLGDASGLTGNLQLRLTGNHSGVGTTRVQFSALGDAAGSALQFIGGTSDSGQSLGMLYQGASALTFDNRQVQLLNRLGSNWEQRDSILANNSTNAAHTWTINTDLGVLGGSGGSQTSRVLVLSGTNTGNNAFNGVINDGTNPAGIGLGKTGGGTWLVGGNNTYSGLTNVSAGVLNIRHANALGSTVSGTTVANAARLELQGGITTAAEALTLTPGDGGAAMLLNVSGNNIWSGSVTSNTATNTHVSRIQSDAGKLTLAGAVNITGSAHQLVFQGNGDLEISGQVTGAGRISGSVTGTGVRTLSNDTNNYTGATAVNGGTLAFTSIGNVGATSSSLGAPVLADATINIGGTTTAGTLSYVGTAGGGHTSDRLISLAGSTGGATIEASGTGALVLTGAVTGAGSGAKTLTLGGTNTLNNSIAAIGQNSVPNQVSVTKEGAGSWVLTGTNTYTGATTISNGKLIVDGSTHASSAVSVGASGTLGGTGTINGTLAVSGTLAPGTGSGDIQGLAAGTTTWNSGSIWNFDLSSSGTTSDQLNITGDFAKGGAGTYQFNFMGSTPAWNTTFVLATWTTGTTAFTSSDFSLTNLGAGPYGTSFFTLDSGARTLSFTAVPEPTTMLAGLLLGAGLMRRRRSA